MLVIENGNGLFHFFEGCHDSFEEPAAWIKDLPFVVGRILAMLADAQNAIDRQLLASQGERSFDRVMNRELVLLGQIAAQIFLGKLIDIHRNQAQVGPSPAVV